MTESSEAPAGQAIDQGMFAICNDLQDETEDLLAVLRPLGGQDWDRPTPASGWSVRDQISHLAFFDETGTLAATDPDAFAASAKQLMQSADADSAGLGRGRAMRPTEVLDWFTTVRTHMIDVFRPMDRKARLPWYGPAMGALSFATARLMETWAHGQDIVDTFDLTRVPTSRLRHVAHIGIGARAFSYTTNKRDSPDGAIHVDLTGPTGETWTWNDPTLPDRVSGDALDFCLVVTQRRHLADTNLHVSGPLAHEWMAIAQAFAGAPGTGRKAGQFRHT